MREKDTERKRQIHCQRPEDMVSKTEDLSKPVVHRPYLLAVQGTNVVTGPSTIYKESDSVSPHRSWPQLRCAPADSTVQCLSVLTASGLWPFCVEMLCASE